MSHLPDGNEGKTPLMIAAQNASEPIVKVLNLRTVYPITSFNACVNFKPLGFTTKSISCEDNKSFRQ